MLLDDLVANFKNRKDDRNVFTNDQWHIMQKKNGVYTGDCEDFALTALYKMTGNLWGFWWALVFGDAKIIHCKVQDEGHAVLRYEGRYIDNIQRRWTTKTHLKNYGYTFKWYYGYMFPQVALKMLANKIYKVFS